MSVDRGSPDSEPTVLGIVVHGPVVVARSPGIAMAVRCVFARPGGLEIDLVLRATGIQAEAACRQTFDGHDPGRKPTASADQFWGSEPVLKVEIDGRRAVAYPREQSSSGGEDDFASDLRVSVDALPLDGSITVAASWPQAGLAEGSATLALDSLEHLADRVITLLPN